MSELIQTSNQYLLLQNYLCTFRWQLKSLVHPDATKKHSIRRGTPLICTRQHFWLASSLHQPIPAHTLVPPPVTIGWQSNVAPTADLPRQLCTVLSRTPHILCHQFNYFGTASGTTYYGLIGIACTGLIRPAPVTLAAHLSYCVSIPYENINNNGPRSRLPGGIWSSRWE